MHTSIADLAFYLREDGVSPAGGFIRSRFGLSEWGNSIRVRSFH
jgi:hypothetical protein